MYLKLFLFALLAIAVRTHEDHSRVVEFAPNSYYVYKYSAQLLSGIPELADQYAGLELLSDVVIHAKSQDKVVMRMTNITLGTINNQVPDMEQVEMVHRRTQALEQELSKPVWFTYEHGKVSKLQTEKSEPAWSVNIKKSLLTLFNVNLAPEKIIQSNSGNFAPKPVSYKDLTYYGVYERGINGICETVYEVQQLADPREPSVDQDFVLNVTKTHNYENCLTEPKIVNENIDIKGCQVYCQNRQEKVSISGYYPIPEEILSVCQCDQETQEKPVTEYATTWYNISLAERKPTIEGIVSEGRIIFKTFNEKMMVITKQNVTLDKVKSHHRIELPELVAPFQHQGLSFRIDEVAQSKNQYDMPYYNLFAVPTKQELAVNSVQLIQSIVEDILGGQVSSTKNPMANVLKMIDTLAVMKSDELENIYKEVAQQGRNKRASNKDKIQRQIFLDALPLAGTNSAAKFIKYLIENNQVTEREAKSMVQSVAQNLFLADRRTIQEYLELCQSPALKSRKELQAATCIAFGKMVRKGCKAVERVEGDLPTQQSQYYENDLVARKIVNRADPRKSGFQAHHQQQQQGGYRYEEERQQQEQEHHQQQQWKSNSWNRAFVQQVCDESDLLRYVQMIVKNFEQTQDYQTKLTYLETLVHMESAHVLKVLEPFVSGRLSESRFYQVASEEHKPEEYEFFRTAVIYALHHMVDAYPKELKAMALPIYRDVTESHEVRIAALTLVLAAQPHAHELQSIAHGLQRENNQQVLSMTVSLLQNLARNKYNQRLSQDARDVLASLPKIELNGKYSEASWMTWNFEEKDLYVAAAKQFVHSNESQIPSAGYFGLGYKQGHLIDTPFRVAFQQKGLEKFIYRFIKPSGFLSEIFATYKQQQQQDSTRGRRSLDTAEQTLASLKEKLNLQTRKDDEAKLKLYYQLFEKTGLLALDEAAIKEKIQGWIEEISSVADKLTTGADFHFVKVLMPATYEKVVTSQIGLPVIVRQKHPMIFSLKITNAKLSVSTSAKSPVPVNYNLTAVIHPQVLMARVSHVAAIYEASLGVHAENQFKLSTPMQVSLGYNVRKNLFKVSVVPEVERQVFFHKTEAETFRTSNKISAEPNEVGQDYKSIRTMATPFKWEKKVGQKWMGLGLQIQSNTEYHLSEKIIAEIQKGNVHEAIQHLVGQWATAGLKYREVHVNLKQDQENPTVGFDATFRYKWVADKEAQWRSAEKSVQDLIKSDNYLNKEQADETEEIRKQHERTQAYRLKAYRNRFQEETENYDEDEEASADSEYVEERSVFDYEDVLSLIMGRKVSEEKIKEVTRKLVQKTQDTWIWSFVDEEDQLDQATRRFQNKQIKTFTHDLAMTFVARGPRPTYFAVNAMYIHNVDKRVNLFKADGYLKRPTGIHAQVPQLFCTEAVVAYPRVPGVFSWEPTATQDLKAKISAELGWGPQCNGQGTIKVRGQMEKTEDQIYTSEDYTVEAGRDSRDNRPWYQRQCEIDQSEGKHTSDACEKVLREQTWFNRILLDIDYQNLPKELVNLTRKLDMALKTQYFLNMDLNTIDVENKRNHVRILAHHSRKSSYGFPMMNIYISKPDEEIIFEKIASPIKRFPSALISMKQQLKEKLNQQDSCVLMKKAVRTFDNVTYDMPETPCQYLLAMDCSAQERYAVFVNDVNADAATKIVTVLVQGKEIKIYPNQDSESTQVTIDGTAHQITEEEPKTYCINRNCIKIYLQKSTLKTHIPVTVVEIEKEDVKIWTDGKNVKVTNGQRYRGKTCGLCGNNDRESEKEFQGPNNWIYERADDFVYSYALSGQYCSEIPKPVGKIVYPAQHQNQQQQGYGARANNYHHQQQYDECTSRQTAVLRRGNEICFSTRPVMTCGPKCTTEAQEEREVGFVCLDAHNVLTKQFQDEAARGIVLRNLPRGQTTFHQTMTVISSCAPAA